MSNQGNRSKLLVFQGKYKEFIHEVGCLFERLQAGGNCGEGHGLDHDLLVAAYCLQITPDGIEHEGELAAVAGFMHSLDRHFDAAGVNSEMRYLMRFLPKSVLSEEFDVIRQAVLNHSKLNSEDDSLVLKILKDADRLAGVGPLSMLRSGQFYSHLPSIELNHVFDRSPFSTFADIQSVYETLGYVLEWLPMLRMPKAKEIAAKDFSFGFTALALQKTKEQLVHAGVIDPL